MKGSSTDSRPLKTRLREKQQYCRRTAVQAKDYFKLERILMEKLYSCIILFLNLTAYGERKGLIIVGPDTPTLACTFLSFQ